LVVLLPLLAAGCTSTAPAERPAPVPAPASSLAPDPPRPPSVRGHVLHTTDERLLRVRLDLRGPWTITSVVAEGTGYLVTDDRYFEGTLGMHRLDARGDVVASWASTGPALAGPSGGAAWVSLVAPESGETRPTQIHTSEHVQTLDAQIAPQLTGYDGEVVTFTALEKAGRGFERRSFATDLLAPPRRVSG
jgi:hypothetical protein